MKETYTIEEIAAMSRLSSRTVRSYLAMGVLKGEKVGGAWQFTAEQFSDFLRQDMVRQSVRAKAHAIVYDFLLQEKVSDNTACTVLDLPVSGIKEEAALRKELLEEVNARGLTCSYHYNDKIASARIILRGRPGELAAILAKY